jgi:hypothetical protein
MAPQAAPGADVFIMYAHSPSAGNVLFSLLADVLNAMILPSIEPKQMTFLYGVKPDHPWAEVPPHDEAPPISPQPTTKTTEINTRISAAFVNRLNLNIYTIT